MTGLVLILVAFVFGSIPTGFVLVRLVRGSDIRDVGSGNIGATNVGRVLGRPGWLVTLAADVAKGAIPVLLAQVVVPGDPVTAAAAGYAAIVGHCFTPWLGGKGGKGVATMLGAFGVLAPVAVVAAVVTFGLVVALSRFVSLASMLAALGLLVTCWITHQPLATVVAAAATLLLVVARHRDNLTRLITGTENRIGGHR